MHFRLSLSLLAVLALGCGSRPVAQKPEPVSPAGVAQMLSRERWDRDPEPIPNLAGLHNVLRVSGRIYSGGEPHGDEAFAELARLGVKTVVSVDGIRPDIEGAKRHGLAYVHIPIGYDGVPRTAALALTRLAREVEGPCYVHCHHGNHRGPAAAAIACQAEGSADAAGAIRILEVARTSPSYSGLWHDVAAFTLPAENVVLPSLVESAEVGSLAVAMAKLDRGFDNLKLCRNARWSAPAEHPDVVPLREAALVKEELRESGRKLSLDHDAQFRESLSRAEMLASELEAALQAGEREQAALFMTQLEESCQQCHAKYRN